jgi:hypothetical protein
MLDNGLGEIAVMIVGTLRFSSSLKSCRPFFLFSEYRTKARAQFQFKHSKSRFQIHFMGSLINDVVTVIRCEGDQ